MEQVIEQLPELEPRPFIMKCTGRGLQACDRCARALAPVAEPYQRWVDPRIEGGHCRYAANIEKFSFIYQPILQEVAARFASQHGGPPLGSSDLDGSGGAS